MKKPEVWLFDLDGTLANIDHRDPYDASRCDEDPPNKHVLLLAKALQSAGFGIICTSGRKERERAKTHAFLVWHGVVYLGLFMRADYDQRPDHTIKEELYRRYIAPRFDVIGVFDDRPSVCWMWRGQGLPVFQVLP